MSQYTFPAYRKIPQQCILMLMLLSVLAIAYAQQAKAQDQDKKAVMKTVLKADLTTHYLRELSPELGELLREEILAGSFAGVLSAVWVKKALSLKKGGPDSIQDLMLKLLPLASGYALPPVSNFRVGAVSQGQSGALYLGANLEIAHGPLGFAVHAEQSAINNAVLHNEKGIKRITVTAAPCGHCRQFMNELEQASELEIIVRGQKPTTLSELLPQSFSPLDLGLEHGLLHSQKPIKQCALDKPDVLACQGIQAMHQSYAPHSASPATITIQTKTATVVGAYIENVAYNPSLPPLQSALDRLRFQQTGIAGIKEVVLIEMDSAKISQVNYTKAVLDEIAPDARFRLITINNKP